MSKRALGVYAGPDALRELREHGLRPERIGTVAGASGGPKWLVLAGLDQRLLAELTPRFQAPVSLIGSSIGAWRFACWAQNDPLAALERFVEAYLEQRYSAKPTRAEISRGTNRVLNRVMGEHGLREVLEHPVFRTHISTVRCTAWTASENRPLLALGLLAAAVFNSVSRKSLTAFFSRTLFHDARADSVLTGLSDFKHRNVELSEANLTAAILASGAIPLVIAGQKDIAGAPTGVYRDGGVIDYHLDLPFSESDRLTLYPHFYSTITPGWFDKNWRGRLASAANFRNVIVLAPTADFVSELPGSKIPDRSDFTKLSDEVRIARWREVVSMSQCLGEEFSEMLRTQTFGDVAQALDLRRP
ncbi:MAG: patatin-like phospholipase family protein [Pseudomonadota bacterium]